MFIIGERSWMKLWWGDPGWTSGAHQSLSHLPAQWDRGGRENTTKGQGKDRESQSLSWAKQNQGNQFNLLSINSE